MTTIILLRHAEAGVGETDFTRPLTATGQQQAVQAGSWLRGIGFEAQAAIVSGSSRTAETYRLLGQSLTAEPDDAVYNASSARLAGCVRGLADHVASVIVVAHNPGISDLARQCGHHLPLGPGSAVVVVSPGVPANFQPRSAQVRGTFVPES